MQFTAVVKVSPKQCCCRVTWRANRWSLFLAERECVVACLTMIIVSLLKWNRCAVSATVVHWNICLVCWSLEVRERINVCFRLEDSFCLFCSVCNSCRLEWWGPRGALCLGAGDEGCGGGGGSRGVVVVLMHPFKTAFPQRHNNQMTSVLTLYNKDGEKKTNP